MVDSSFNDPAKLAQRMSCDDKGPKATDLLIEIRDLLSSSNDFSEIVTQLSEICDKLLDLPDYSGQFDTLAASLDNLVNAITNDADVQESQLTCLEDLKALIEALDLSVTVEVDTQSIVDAINAQGENDNTDVVQAIVDQGLNDPTPVINEIVSLKEANEVHIGEVTAALTGVILTCLEDLKALQQATTGAIVAMDAADTDPVVTALGALDIQGIIDAIGDQGSNDNSAIVSCLEDLKVLQQATTDTIAAMDTNDTDPIVSSIESLDIAGIISTLDSFESSNNANLTGIEDALRVAVVSCLEDLKLLQGQRLRRLLQLTVLMSRLSLML